MSINTAHKSIFLLFILTVTYLLLLHRRPLSAGAVFGLIAFKPHLGILIGLAMLLKGQWRFVAGCLATVSCLVGLSLIAGIDLCNDYFWQCLSMNDYINTSGYLLAESHNLTGAIALSLNGFPQLMSIVWWSSVTAVIAMVGLTMRGEINFQSRSFALQFSALVLATILLSPHFYIYDLTIILLPVLLISFSLFDGVKNLWPADTLVIGEKHRKSLVFSGVAIFVGTGLTTTFAQQFQFQPTILIMLGMVFCICHLLSGESKRLSPNSMRRYASN